MVNLVHDEGWDSQIVGTSSKGYKALKENLVDYGLIAHYNNNTYIYLSATNKWGVLISAEAQRQICDITGSENATVSYLNASLPYIPFMEKHARRTGATPVSICIGTRRLIISKSGDKITLSQAEAIASVDENLDFRVQQFCIMPLSFDQFPISWSLADANQKLFKYLRVLFIDPTEFETILWIIGMIAIDPGSSSKFLLLVGEGGNGKSTIISTIEDIFKGCCGTISSNVLTAKINPRSAETAQTIASNRVVTAGDIDLDDAHINLHTIKEITGNDSMSIPPIKVRTRCSLIAAANKLPDPRKQKNWCTAAISRRTVAVPMNVKTSMIPKRQRPDTVADLMDLLMMGVNIYLDNELSMPISLRSLLLSIIGWGYIEVADKVELDMDATQQSVIDANTGIELYFGLDTGSLGELASLVCPNFIVNYSGILFIGNIVLKEQLST